MNLIKKLIISLLKISNKNSYKGLDVKFIEQPNENLDIIEKERLVEGFKNITREVYPVGHENFTKKITVDSYFKKHDILTLVYDGHILAGWFGFSIFEEENTGYPIYHLDTINLRSKYQNMGLAKYLSKQVFIRYILKNNSKFYVTARTQNPATYKSFRSFSLNNIYPNNNMAVIPDNFQSIGQKVCSAVSPDKVLLKDKLIIKNALSNQLYDDAHYSKDDSTSKFLREALDYKSGDLFILVAFVDIASIGSLFSYFKVWKKTRKNRKNHPQSAIA